jgi:Leucine-rich repeat (LRR) protein
MRKTTQKNPEKTEKRLKIVKIDFQNDPNGNGGVQSVSDVRFDSRERGEIPSTPTPTLKQIIQNNLSTKQLFLRFYAYPLERIPEEIGELKHLQGLSILHCQLRRLPPYIADLQRLRHLFLINNRLTELPDELIGMKNLQYLDVSENQLVNVPTDFESLIKMTDLYLDKNRLTELPPSIALFNKLIRLGLSGNQLTFLPNLNYEWQKLIWLNLADNRFTDLPERFSQLAKLEWLNLSGNPLTFIPKTLLKLPKIELLFLRNCGLIDLPKDFALLKTLQVLDISGNSFYGGKIPSVVFQLPCLEELIATDCGLQQIVEEDFLLLKNLCIIRLQNNKIRYISRKLARMEQAEEFNFSGNPLEYVAPEIYQLPLLKRLLLNDTVFEQVQAPEKTEQSAETKLLETFEPEVIRIREQYNLEKRRNFM